MRKGLALPVLLVSAAWPGLGRAQSFNVEKVVEGVYAAIPRQGVPVGSNGAFIVNPDDVIVVDTHYRPSFARELLSEIKKVTALPVKYVINSKRRSSFRPINRRSCPIRRASPFASGQPSRGWWTGPLPRPRAS